MKRVLVKFTNVKYYRGGGKKPYRLRFNQNYTQFINKEWLDRVGNEYVIKCLSELTDGRIIPTKTTKIILVKEYGF